MSRTFLFTGMVRKQIKNVTLINKKLGTPYLLCVLVQHNPMKPVSRSVLLKRAPPYTLHCSFQEMYFSELCTKLNSAHRLATSQPCIRINVLWTP